VTDTRRDRSAPISRSDRELVASLRAEVAAVDPTRSCDRRAEVAGLGTGSPRRRSSLARLVLRLGRAEEGADFDWDRSAEHCRMAWLRGLFLARGSLSLASGRTHLELVVDPDLAPMLVTRLARADLPASWRIRRGRGVVTWKSADTVKLFLRRIGAGATLLELESRQVSRSMRGDLNRVINAESGNLQRAVVAAGRQLAAIALLEAEGRMGEQPYVVRLVADARRQTPEATLADLAERTGVTRSAVQRALERIERLALHPADRPSRRRRLS